MDAPSYPVAFVWEEVQLFVERQNRTLATEATLLKAAINTGIAAFGKDGGRKANNEFNKLIRRLNGEGIPERPMKKQSDRAQKGRQGNGR